MWSLVLLQWCHVIVATFWVGGFLTWAFVVWPVMFRLPAEQVAPVMGVLGPRFGATMGLSAFTTLILGIVRGTLFGQIKHFGDLNTPYGHTFMTAGLLTASLIALAAWTGAQVPTRVFDGPKWREGGHRFLWTAHGVIFGLMLAVLGCMVGMRFGL